MSERNEGHARIVMEGHGLGSIWIDGKELKHVTEFELSAGHLLTNRLKLTLEVQKVEFDGVVEVGETDE